MKKLVALVIMAALLGPMAASPALARGGHGHRGGHHGFNHGRWHHGWHNGHFGRWWVVGPNWTYYPSYPARYYYPPAYYRRPVYSPYAAPVYVAPPVAAFSFNIR